MGFPNWEIWGESNPRERLGVTLLLSYEIIAYFNTFSCISIFDCS